ncbi:MAG: hypothetical protein ACRC9O_13320 [Plesiomonas sp.]|uniref:hypothetical protein n=1 Tax=Plesiomonas sp. TaxID=2486279 RepID=UPI003F2FC204
MPIQNSSSSLTLFKPEYLGPEYLGRETTLSGTPIPMPRNLKRDSGDNDNSDKLELNLKCRSTSLSSLSGKVDSAVTLNRFASLSSVSKAVISNEHSLLSSVQSKNTESSPEITISSAPILSKPLIASSPMNAEVVNKTFNKLPLSNVVEEYGFFRRVLESIRRIFCSDNTNKHRAVEYELGVKNLKFIQAIEQRSKEAGVFFKGNNEVKEIVNLQFLAEAFADNGALLSLTNDDGGFLFKLSVPVLDSDGEYDQLEKSIRIKPELVGLCEHSYDHSTGQVYPSSVYIENGFFGYYYSVMASKLPQINNNEGGRLEEQDDVINSLRLDNKSLLNKIKLLESEKEKFKNALAQEETKLNGLAILAKDSEKGLLNEIKSLKEELEANKFDLVEANKIVLNTDLAGWQNKLADFEKLKDDFSELNAQNVKIDSELKEYHGYVVKLKKQLKDNKELLTKNNADYALHYSKYVDSIASTSNELEQARKMFSDLKCQYDENIIQTGNDAKVIEDLNIEIKDLKLLLESKRGNAVTRALKKIGQS